DDHESAAQPVAVLSWAYFQRAFSGNATPALGPTRVLNGQSYTTIGVAPKAFTGTDANAPSIWVPLGTATDLGYDARMVRSRFASLLTLVGRLAPAATR